MNLRSFAIIFLMLFGSEGIHAQIGKGSVLNALPLSNLSVKSSANLDRSGNKHAKQAQTYASNSVLSGGSWYRLGVNNTGIQKITYSMLAGMGITLPLDATKIRIFGNGGSMLPEMTNSPRTDDLKQLAIFVQDHGDGQINSPGDYILFYAEGPDVWTYDSIHLYYTHQKHLYSDNSCYFLNIGTDNGFRVNNVSSSTTAPNVTVSTFNDHLFHEKDSLNLIMSGKIWFGEVFNNQLSYTFHFDLPDVSMSDSVIIRTSLAARAFDTSYYQFNAWGKVKKVYMDIVDLNVNSDFAKMNLPTIKVLPSSGNLDFVIDYNRNDETATGWLNYIEINAIRHLDFHGGQLGFRNFQVLGSGVAEYVINGVTPACRLWQVTDAVHIKEISMNISGNQGKFRWDTDTLHEYVLFDTTQYFSPVFIENVANQDLHSLAVPDMIIITHPDFRTQADRLAQYHRDMDGLNVLVTEPQIIYNEFSSGMQDPTAIRDFIRMFYVRAASDSNLYPHYVLLFGEGSYDMKNRINPNANFIPTYQTWNSLTPTGSFVSDDYFGLLGDGEGPNAYGLVDAGVGRLPAITNDEAKTMVDKIIRYSSRTDLLPPSSSNSITQISNFADWRNMMTFIADDQDADLHLKQAETLVNTIDSLDKVANIEKLYLDAFVQEKTSNGYFYPDVHDAINNRVMKGALIINYTGHGGETGLADERVLVTSDIENWHNYYNLPVFITATCEFSRYDNPGLRSMGELILIKPDGGAVAMLSTTRVAYAHSNLVINTNILKAAFRAGASHRLGDIMRIGKDLCGTGIYIQNFTLLGDPAMSLAIPELNIITAGIDGDTISSSGDTIYAGNQVTINGYIADSAGAMQQGFNGEIYPTIFDKPALQYTLANDPDSYVIGFYSLGQVLFKGRSSVTNGKFSFTFTVPKDVAFGPGKAKVSYYAKSPDQDAAGYCNNLGIVNSGNAGAGNGKGSDIKLYMNDRGFVTGGITGADPVFIADLADEDGIDYFNVGFGHDIIAVLDSDFANPIVLNDFYQPALDNSRQGTLSFPFQSLAEGAHQIWLRAWDVLDYSSEASITFTVRVSGDFSLNHVKVIPNPFAQNTTFCLDRNITTGTQWVDISIKTLDGRTIREMEQQFSYGQPTSVCIVWDGAASNGQPVPQGIYIYTLRLQDESGATKQYNGKLVRCR